MNLNKNRIESIDALTHAPFTDLQNLYIAKNSIQNLFSLLNFPFKNLSCLYIVHTQNSKIISLGIKSHFEKLFYGNIIRIEN